MFSQSRPKHKTSRVFVPGGMPSLTYVARTARDLEPRLAAAKDNLCKLVTLTGATKSGKTVLANRLYPRSQPESIWVDGGTIHTENDLWTNILAVLGGSSSTEETSTSEVGGSVSGEGHGEIKVPFVAKGGARAGASTNIRKSRTQRRTLAGSPKATAIRMLRDSQLSLIIDDFHYIDREFQGNIIRALKPLIFEGHPVILIAIPHRRYDVVKVEREMTGRLESISVPSWTTDELIEIPATGFPLLNVNVQNLVTSQMAAEAYGSPHLMQEFCRKLANEHGIIETASNPVQIDRIGDGLYRSISEETGKVIFDKLMKGPRQRSDRMKRPLVGGGKADIYQVVLRALARLAPGMQEVDYQDLRNAIKAVLSDNVPQAHEVSRVLAKMSEIASSDEASTPVIDWEEGERRLHITDPFFAFFLKWGASTSD